MYISFFFWSNITRRGVHTEKALALVWNIGGSSSHCFTRKKRGFVFIGSVRVKTRFYDFSSLWVYLCRCIWPRFTSRRIRASGNPLWFSSHTSFQFNLSHRNAISNLDLLFSFSRNSSAFCLDSMIAKRGRVGFSWHFKVLGDFMCFAVSTTCLCPPLPRNS